MGSRPRPLDYKTEAEFLDAVAAYVMGCRAANKAYTRKIDLADERRRAGNKVVKPKLPLNRQPKTLHDILNENPVLRAMHKQGKLF